MKSRTWFLLATALHLSFALQEPFNAQQVPGTKHPLISDATNSYIRTLLKRHGSSGLSVAVVRKDASEPTGWNHEFSAHGVAQADGTLVNPDSVFAIASNSKLFLAISVGLLISNETLAKERGTSISWNTKFKDLVPEWELVDPIASAGTTLQDMLSHRTGMPRHDFSRTAREAGIVEVISTLRYLRPSAGFRETFQYNNFMYQALQYLPQALLNQSYDSYISQHLFEPLNMTSTTLSVADAEKRGTFAHAFRRDEKDIYLGNHGALKAVVPYFARPGEEVTWAGAGGVLSSAKDLSTWVSMLLNSGRHPYTNETIVPEAVVERCAYGRSVGLGSPDYPEWSPKVYGAGQFRYSYRGHDVIEHGGSNSGFRTQVSRLPNDNLAVVVLSNDEMAETIIVESVKFRILDELLGLEKIAWDARFVERHNEQISRLVKSVTPRPSSPRHPSNNFSSLAAGTFYHPTYGIIEPCLVSPSATVSVSEETVYSRSDSERFESHAHCESLLASRPVRRLLRAGPSYPDTSDTSPALATYIIPFKRVLSTHLRLEHFDGNLFNLTLVWSNAEVRKKEGYSRPCHSKEETCPYEDSEDDGDLLIKEQARFEIEWVHKGNGQHEEGLAVKGGFWGEQGPDSRSPSGTGMESAEVWFKRIH